MRGSQVKICQLQEFVTLAETLNYSKAAKKHFLSTSALSKHIVSLENAVSATLFTRDARSVELTDDGQLFYEGMQPILEDMERFMSDFRRRQHGLEKRLMVSLAIRPPYLVSALSEIGSGEQLPFHVSYVSSLDRPYERFLEETPDSLAIMYNSQRIDTERFGIEKLTEVPLVAVLPVDHPLASKERLSFDRDLNGQTLVKLTSRFFAHGWDAIETLLERHGVQAKSTSSFVASSFELAILNGLRDILLIPQAPTAPLTFLESGRYKVLEFEERRCFEVVGVWARDMTEPLIAQTYAALLREALGR